MENKAAVSTKKQSFSVVKLQSHFSSTSISNGDAEHYPNLCSLLTSAASHLNEDGLTTQTDKDLKQAKEMLRREKHSWLLNHILYLEVQELLLDYELKTLEMSLSSRDQQFSKLLQHSLRQAEICDYLDFSPDPSSKVTTLGLTVEELDRQNQYKKHSGALQQALIPEVEERLRKRCENLVLAHQPDQTSSDSSKLMFAKSSQLPALVETDKLHLEEGRQLLKQDIANSHRQFAAYYQKLLDSLKLLERLISEFKLKQQVRHDDTMTEWLYAKCDAICLKIKTVELQVLFETYTAETLEALKKVRGELDRAYKESEKEKIHREQALAAYQSAGQGFDDIVAEFGKLKADFENKQWAITELNKTQKPSDT